MHICAIGIIILICQKLGLVGPMQQKIKLPSPHDIFDFLIFNGFLEIPLT